MENEPQTTSGKGTENEQGYGFIKAETLPVISSAFWALLTVDAEKRIEIAVEKVFQEVRLRTVKVRGSGAIMRMTVNGSKCRFERGEMRENS